MRLLVIIVLSLLASTMPLHAQTTLPRIVGHRGLMRSAPENTLAGFAACAHLRFGIEVDVRRTKDGVLVVVHDADVSRTTNGTGKVRDLTLAELRKLDAGRWFSPAFAGERVPTLEEVFILIKTLGIDVLIALDIKEDDETMAGNIVQLAEKHGVLAQCVCIGLAISDPKLRARLKAASAKMPVAVLANQRSELASALSAKEADWICVRFIPTADEVKAIHAQKKRVFLVGPLVAGHEPANWQKAREAGVDAILTDYPVQCLESWRSKDTLAPRP